MIEQLFGSKTRVKLLQLFYKNPNRSFYVREITRKIDEQINSVRRELSNLLSIGIIESDSTNNKLYYEVNQNFSYYDALSNMFGDKKMVTNSPKNTKKINEDSDDKNLDNEQSMDPFAKSLSKTGNVNLAFFTGQFTRDNRANVDIVIVGDVNLSAIESLIKELEITEKKELRYSIFTPEEYKYREQINDRFVTNIKDAKKVVLIDKDNRF